MVRRILGSAFVASPQSVSRLEGTPEEPCEAIARRILKRVVLPPHNLFLGEWSRQRSYLSLWCVAIRAPHLLPPHNLHPGERACQRSRGTLEATGGFTRDSPFVASNDLFRGAEAAPGRVLQPLRGLTRDSPFVASNDLIRGAKVSLDVVI